MEVKSNNWNKKYSNKNILIVSHGMFAEVMPSIVEGADAKKSKYFVAGTILSTFNFTQSIRDEDFLLHEKEVQSWVEKIQSSSNIPSYCKPFAIHQIDRMLLLTNYLQHLVAKIN